jgi:hypothetical protein
MFAAEDEDRAIVLRKVRLCYVKSLAELRHL